MRGMSEPHSKAGGNHAEAVHTHGHHLQTGQAETKLRIALGLTIIILAVEVAGGFISNSLALLADAAHMLTDVFAVALSLFAVVQSRRPADDKRTFGYHRVGILTALLNSAALLPISAFIIWEAIGRFAAPPHVESGVMFWVALVGLVANALIGFNLHGAAGESLNIRSAVIHVMGDAAASGGVLVAALVIAFTGWTPVDPILSIAIALLVAFSGWRVVRETVGILLESVPKSVDVAMLVSRMQSIEGVHNVHDLHIWEISQGISALSCHVLLDNQMVSQSADVLAQLNKLLEAEFHIGHSTIQPECVGCDLNLLYCSLSAVGAAEGHHHH